MKAVHEGLRRCRRYLLLTAVLSFGLLTIISSGGGSSNPSPGVADPAATAIPGISLDDAARISKILSPETGGSVSTVSKGITYMLSIPPMALKTAMEISVTPVSSIEKLPVGGAEIPAVHLSPAGLVLDVPATLTFSLPGGTTAGRAIMGFIMDDDGQGFELLPAAMKEDKGTIKILHFSTAGLIEDEEKAIEALLEKAKDKALKQYYGVGGFLEKLSLAYSCNDDFMLQALQHARDLMKLADSLPPLEFGARRCFYGTGYWLLPNFDICPACSEPVPPGVVDDPKCSSVWDLGEASRGALWKRIKEIFLERDNLCHVNPALEGEALACIALVQEKKYGAHFLVEPVDEDLDWMPEDILFANKSCGLHSFIVEPETVEMSVGEVASLQVIARDQAGNPLPDREVIWLNNEKEVLALRGEEYTVQVTGKGSGIGSVEVYDRLSFDAGMVPMMGNTADYARIYVDTPIPEPEGLKVRVNPQEVCLPVFRKRQLSARILDLDNRPVPGIGPYDVVWRTSDSSVVSVNIEGLALAQSPGRVQIEATYAEATGVSSVFVPKFPDDYALTPVLDYIHLKINDDREPIGDVEQLLKEAEERCGLDLPDGGLADMNNNQQVIGNFFLEGRGGVGGLFDLDTCELTVIDYPGAFNTSVVSVNDRGQVLGSATLVGTCALEIQRLTGEPPDPMSYDEIAFIYDPVTLSFTHAGPSSAWRVSPIDMNINQDVIGRAEACAFEWNAVTEDWDWTGEEYFYLKGMDGSSTKLSDAYKHEPVFTFEPAAINDRGLIVGFERGISAKGAIYSQGGYIIPDLPGGSEFLDINNSDDILVAGLPTPENPEGLFIMHLCPLRE